MFVDGGLCYVRSYIEHTNGDLVAWRLGGLFPAGLEERGGLGVRKRLTEEWL